MPSSVGSASKAASASSNDDQVVGSFVLAFLPASGPAAWVGIFVHLPSRRAKRKVTHWGLSRKGAGMVSVLTVERGGRTGTETITRPPPRWWRGTCPSGVDGEPGGPGNTR